jgi:exopolyphosphatase/guanosine-5'-triphosphate,3'-diphosphate pyrophosphatase
MTQAAQSALKANEKKEPRGLRYWMEEVIAQAEKTRDGFKADPVHDLRTAMRRCRSIGEGFSVLDPESAWKKMRQAAKPVFSALGNLRDVQVQIEWVEKLGEKDDLIRLKLLDHFQQREGELKTLAAESLAAFDLDQWSHWIDLLEERSKRLPLGGEVFQVMALERWRDARALQATALRNRSKLSLHQLRIGIKKFRYIVENFLPELHRRWIKDLKKMQDLLGEVHDLDVLWETARTLHIFVNPEQRKQWFSRIQSERSQRVDAYRAKMLGKNSFWHVWRSGLPEGEALHTAILKHFETWAFYRDPDLTHTHRVLEMSLALLGAIDGQKKTYEQVSYRDLLSIAVLTHEAGHDRRRKHHKETVRLLGKLVAPPGWLPAHLQLVGMIARYHRGALPSESQKTYGGLDASARSAVQLLGGILRLADSFDRNHDGAIQGIEVARSNGLLQVRAPGFQPLSPAGERTARARHLLESAIALPVWITG